MVSFAIAHISYLTAFGMRPLDPKLAVAPITFSLLMSILLVPVLDDIALKVGVPIYSILLLSMLWRSLARLQHFNKNLKWSWTKIGCSVGALMFVISDTVLSFDMFMYDIPYSYPVIMITYYLAQLGICLSVLDSFTSHEINHLVITRTDLVNGAYKLSNYIKSFYYEDNIKLIDSNQNEPAEVKSNIEKSK